MALVEKSGIRIDQELCEFIETEAIRGSGLDSDRFWSGFAEIIAKFQPRRKKLLETRQRVQKQLDLWHKERRGRLYDLNEYRSYLEEIGYLVPAGSDFTIETENIDDEIAKIAAPQLVVPITNARFALNAANARWNSLYDALYGTDALGSSPGTTGYDRERGRKVISWTKEFLDDIFPLEHGSHASATKYSVAEGALRAEVDGNATGLFRREQFVGHRGEGSSPTSVLLKNNNLHVEIAIDESKPSAADDSAGVADVILESAVTTIVDCEDSVAVVDASDKVLAYKNWLGLIDGTLVASIKKGGAEFSRSLEADREYVGSDGKSFALKGRSLLLVRNVGLLMDFPGLQDSEGSYVGECILDAMCTSLIASRDVKAGRRNSNKGSIYVVVPKLHGPKEVEFADDLFGAVERVLDLPRYTVKLGVMDEERRTTVNLKECIRAAKNRIAFINTGFLDRTGDEIHTSMEAGAFLRKADIKNEDWISAYEDWNVDTGLSCGLDGTAQIGKGMWAMPDLMGDMLEQKIAHPKAGANTAWVPSPTAATLHAVHYHRVNVAERQAAIKNAGPRAKLDAILTVPLADRTNWSKEDLLDEIENNLQGILGYVVRWIDQGVGCSKVPDRRDVALMEDRATCRISSQHLSNWLHHGIVDAETVEDAMKRMARVVDQQNESDPNYSPMAPDFDGEAFRAARDLVFEGRVQPSGYTEPILHRRRLERKDREAEAI